MDFHGIILLPGLLRHCPMTSATIGYIGMLLLFHYNHGLNVDLSHVQSFILNINYVIL